MVDFLFFCAANDVSHPILDRQRGEWPETLYKYYSIFPKFIPQRRPIKLLAIILPQRHEIIHIRNKPLIVMTLEQMNHLMYNNVLQTIDRFLDQLEIQPDALSFNITRAPFGFHLFYAPLCHLHADNRFPFNDQGSILLQLISPLYPIMPILNSLLRLLIHINTLQLHQRNG
jgi:hypothetical protein